MCDANDYALKVVIGSKEKEKSYVIYYVSMTLSCYQWYLL